MRILLSKFAYLVASRKASRGFRARSAALGARGLAEQMLRGEGILARLIIGFTEKITCRAAALHAGTRIHALPPGIDVGKIVECLALAVNAFHHAPARHIGNRIFAG